LLTFGIYELFKLRETWECKVVEDEEADEVAKAIPENGSTGRYQILTPSFYPCYHL